MNFQCSLISVENAIIGFEQGTNRIKHTITYKIFLMNIGSSGSGFSAIFSYRLFLENSYINKDR